MFFYTYIIESPSGKYYVGRHSTSNIDDGYMGSGKWVKSVTDRSSLKKTILQFCEDEFEVKSAEQQLLDTHVGLPNCMNFNNRSSGWASGIRNISCDPEVKARRSKNSWTKTDAGRVWISENNPSKLPHVKKLRSDAVMENTAWTSRWNLGELHPSKTEESRENMRLNNPAKTEQAREKISQSSKFLVETGVIRTFADAEVQQKAIETKRKKFASGELFISDEHKEKLSQSALNQQKLECPHCGKIASLSNAKGYHFDKCKSYTTL